MMRRSFLFSMPQFVSDLSLRSGNLVLRLVQASVADIGGKASVTGCIARHVSGISSLSFLILSVVLACRVWNETYSRQNYAWVYKYGLEL